MKKIYMIAAALSVVFAAVSCNKEDVAVGSSEPIVVRFTAQAADVKAQFNPTSYENGAAVPVLWDGGENLSIAVGDKDAKDFARNCATVTASDDKTSATWAYDFSKLSTNTYTPAAPYTFHVFCGAVRAYRNGEVSRVLLDNIPSEQTPGENSCDPKAIFLYSKSAEYQTWPSEVVMNPFEHLTAYGCITLGTGIPDDEKILSVTITADASTHLSGATWYYYKTGNKYGDYIGTTSPKPSCSITLKPAEDGALPRENLWFGCRPTMNLASLSFTVTTDKGVYEVVKSELGGKNFQAGKVVKVTINSFAPVQKSSLKVGILGDSISTYEGYIDGSYKSYYPREEDRGKADVDDWTKTYWGILLNQYWHADLDVNASYSGTCITPRDGFSTDFMTRALTFKDPDVIIVNGGTNDYLKGKKGDGVVTPEKFKAAYEALLAALQKNYPKAQIIMVVCDFVKGDYGDISVATAGKFGVPCVDLRADTKSIGKVYGDKTNPHPNAVGMAFIAEKIYNQTKSIVDAIKK